MNFVGRTRTHEQIVLAWDASKVYPRKPTNLLCFTSGIVNPTSIGLYTAVPYIMGAIFMIVVGRLSDASGERRGFVSVLMVLAAVGLMGAGMFAKQTGLLVFALGILGGGVVAAVPAFWALPPTFSFPYYMTMEVQRIHKPRKVRTTRNPNRVKRDRCRCVGDSQFISISCRP